MNVDISKLSDQMPEFSNHEEARNWFKEQFQNSFLLRSSDVIDGNKIYFYHIIKDLETYQQYMESFAKLGDHQITSTTPFESYSTIEINEDGNVNIYD